MLRAFPVSLTGAASRWLRNQSSGLITTWEVLKTKFLNKLCPPARTAKKMEEINNFQTKSTKTSDGLAAIQAQLNNLGREIKKVNEKVYAAQFGAPYQPGGQYRVAGPGFYQRNNGNSSYPARRETMEESLAKFMAESAKRHEENSNIIKEIRASTDAAIRNQGASIKTLELHIGQNDKVYKKRVRSNMAPQKPI
ncbi:putative reverse transcriptase domain-containing protein [Tanacetum coccineum]